MSQIILKTSNIQLYYFYIAIAFLFPRGFGEYNVAYHQIMKLLVWSSVIIIIVTEIPTIILNYINKTSLNYALIALYFISAIIITYFSQNGIESQLQQMIAVPFLCIFFINNLKTNAKHLLNCFSLVFIISLLLNLVLTPIAFGFDTHIIFLGHVQLVSQYCLSALVISYIYITTYRDNRLKMIVLIVLSLITMLFTDADSAVFSALIFLLFILIYKFKFSNLLFFFNIKALLLCLLILNIIVIYLTAINQNIIPGLNFSGRSFVWKEAILKIKDQPLFGYGMDGVLLEPFWIKLEGGTGFNYAHNQILQNLLDGGFVLTILFWIMVWIFIKPIEKIKERKYRVISIYAVIVLMFIMIFESSTIYCYIYIVLSVLHMQKYYIGSNNQKLL